MTIPFSQPTTMFASPRQSFTPYSFFGKFKNVDFQWLLVIVLSLVLSQQFPAQHPDSMIIVFIGIVYR